MAKFRKAPDEVVAIVEHMIDLYHEHLKTARIGLMFRDEAPIRDGYVVYGEARKVSDLLKPFVPYDFLIWFAEDRWELLIERQKQALADHELTHCYWDGAKASIRRHDINEFLCIIERHGFWWPNDAYVRRVQEVVQTAMPFAHGHVAGVGEDVLDQVGNLFGDE